MIGRGRGCIGSETVADRRSIGGHRIVDMGGDRFEAYGTFDRPPPSPHALPSVCGNHRAGSSSKTGGRVADRTATMATDTKTDDTRDRSLDDDILKGGILVGAIAGEEARLATAQEHSLTFVQAIKLYPKAVGWSVFFSLGIIMTAFDPQLLGQLFATPRFQRDFGYKFEGKYIISAPWQTGLLMGSPIGQVVGAFYATYP